MKVSIKDFNVDWKQIKNECRATINMGDSDKEPTEEWKKKLLICKHSPIRVGTILIHIEDIPYYVMGHLVRHNVGVVPFVGTSREDRTGIPRSEKKQTDLVSMDLLVNIESLMNISVRRLCMCADKETIKVWKAVLEEIKKYDESIYWANVPQCIQNGGCIELFGNCKYYDTIMEEFDESNNIIKRYNYYHSKVD